MLQNILLNPITDSYNKWMVVLWEDNYLLLLKTFIWSKWKMMLQYHLNTMFYCRFVDDIYSRWKLGENALFDRLNSYHPNIKLIIDVNPSKFLDTKLTNISGTYKFNVYQKNTKLPSPWTSKTPKCYKWNTINGDLHRSKRISSNFDEEIPLIKEKFLKADYSLHFINSVFNEFRKGKECGDESFIIPTSLFEIATPLKFV